MVKEKLRAQLEFNADGKLLEILVQANTEKEESIIAGALAKFVESADLVRVCPNWKA